MMKEPWEKLNERANHNFSIILLQEFYPINYLRNIALNYTSAKYVFLSDVDFAPNYGLHKYLQSFIDDGELELKKVRLYIVTCQAHPVLVKRVGSSVRSVLLFLIFR